MGGPKGHLQLREATATALPGSDNLGSICNSISLNLALWGATGKRKVPLSGKKLPIIFCFHQRQLFFLNTLFLIAAFLVYVDNTKGNVDLLL